MPSVAREGMGAVTITRHDDGALAMVMDRYEVETTAYTDQRAIPIGESTYEALAAALFAPKGEPAVPPRPVVTEAVVVSTVDGEHRNLNHQIREEIGDDGRVTLTVRGLGGGETRTVSMFDPAVAAYIDRRLALMEETVARPDTADRTGIAAPEPIPLGAGRPDLTVVGRMSYRLSWAWTADAGIGLGIEIAEGVTRVTLPGEGDRPVVVSSASWEVERHWWRLLYAGIVADQPEWWARGVQGRRSDETPAVVSPPPDRGAHSGTPTARHELVLPHAAAAVSAQEPAAARADGGRLAPKPVLGTASEQGIGYRPVSCPARRGGSR